MSTQTLARDWAVHLSSRISTVDEAILSDDVIVTSLYGTHRSHIQPQSIRQQRTVALMSPGDLALTPDQAHQFRKDFDAAERHFLSDQTFDELLTAVEEFMENHRDWCRAAVGDVSRYFKGLTWAFSAYLALIVPWSLAHVSVPRLGGIRQFGVRATRNIPQNQYIYEVLGLLSRDEARDFNTSGLSIMEGLKGGNYAMFGPARLVNHDCNPNVFFEFLFSDNKRAIIARAERDICACEELLVSYGSNWCEADHCPCQTCVGEPLVPTPQPDEVRDPEVAQAAKLRRTRSENARRKEKTKAKKGLAQVPE
ncbi:hypothetical protein B0H13DRAFT_2282706 [Mycena leptocephala]|nr:hypothetical protein B0H13DRAFT_2282706 [Mycena leptocephala]